MKVQLTTVEDAGLVVRALRKHADIRIDDFALTAQVSKQFMSDLENGKPTIQMGRVLALLNNLGVRVTLELPDDLSESLVREQSKASGRKGRKERKSRKAQSPRVLAEGDAAESDAPESRPVDSASTQEPV